jgi:hypothetical protein
MVFLRSKSEELLNLGIGKDTVISPSALWLVCCASIC